MTQAVAGTTAGGRVFFFLSKILVPLEAPSDLLVLCLLFGLLILPVARLRRAGMTMTALASLVFLVITVFPVADWLTAPLENRFPQPSALPDHVDGIIVLGGAIDPVTTAQRGIPSLNTRAERMTEFVRLAKKYPDARLMFSGGSGQPTWPLPAFTEADAARLFFTQQGLDARRILFENKSRNTYENVIFSKALAHPLAGQIWLLISSAADMPRSVGIFRKAGWPVVAVPVAYKSDAPNSYVLSDGLSQLDHGVHEWLGLLVYYLTGKTDALFPAPN